MRRGTKRPVSRHIKKGLKMIKIYCDLCGNEIKGHTYKGQFFKYSPEVNTYGHLEKEVEVCPECFDKLINGWKKEVRQKFTEPEEPEKKGLSIEIINKDEKKKALKEAFEKPKSRKTDPAEEEYKHGKSKNLDDGKIWALAHAREPWTLKAIADEMGCSAATIQNHLKRMREEKGED